VTETERVRRLAAAHELKNTLVNVSLLIKDVLFCKCDYLFDCEDSNLARVSQRLASLMRERLSLPRLRCYVLGLGPIVGAQPHHLQRSVAGQRFPHIGGTAAEENGLLSGLDTSANCE
jgi:hypothetical protein